MATKPSVLRGMWNRSDNDQRTALMAMLAIEVSGAVQPTIPHGTHETLLRRGLITRTGGRRLSEKGLELARWFFDTTVAKVEAHLVEVAGHRCPSCTADQRAVRHPVEAGPPRPPEAPWKTKPCDDVWHDQAETAEAQR